MEHLFELKAIKYYVVLDTNILVSAMLKKKSVPAKILQFVHMEYLIPLFNERILNEYEQVLSRIKFPFLPEDRREVISGITKMGIEIPGEVQSWSLPDASDAVFFEVVMEHRKSERNSYLVTGNLRHFPIKPFVVTPREMLLIVANDLLREHWLLHFLQHVG